MKTKEVAVPTGSTLDLVMESDVLKLDEVVVTANAIQRGKEVLGYAVTSVGPEDHHQRKRPGVLNSLQEKLQVFKSPMVQEVLEVLQGCYPRWYFVPWE